MTTVRARQRTNSQYNGSPEWYTPDWLLARIAAWLGADYYDPCPASMGHINENGLALSWAGRRVYCNPPYGKAIMPWVRKAMTEPVRECVLLVPAYTDTRWFEPLFGANCSLCFVFGRLTFEHPHKRRLHAPHASVLAYRGRRYRQFAQAFADVGPVLRVYQARAQAQAQLFRHARAAALETAADDPVDAPTS